MVLGLYLVDEWLSAVVAEVVEGSAASEMGFEVGDEIVAMNGQRVDLIRIGEKIARLPNAQASFTVLRNNEHLVLSGVIGQQQMEGAKAPSGLLGVRWQAVDVSAYERVERYGVMASLVKGVEKTFYYVRLTFDMFARIKMPPLMNRNQKSNRYQKA